MSGGYIRGNVATVGIGGGVCVAGEAEFTMTGGTISENTAHDGGGVYVAYLGTFIMTGGTIGGVTDADGNSAQTGGGVGVAYGGSFTMNGGTIGYNVADDEGGGVYVNGGEFTISGGAISGNTSFAGGVAMQYGTVTMNGGEISGNMAFMGGCGVYMLGGSFKMTGGAITGNMPVPSEDDTEDMSLGGGVVVSGGTFELDGGSISGNTAQFAGGVLIAEGTFIMKSGSISDNTGVSGAGGILLIMGTLKISGGSITGNKQTQDIGVGYCGGVCVGFPLLGDENVETSFEISGAPIITDNTVVIDGETVINNVLVMDGYVITVTGALTDGAKIGVYVEAIGDIATGYNQAEKPSKYFIPDNPAYCAYISDKDTGTVTIGEHNYSEDFTVDVQPTCTEKGSKSKHCTLCDGKSEVAEIAALNHSFGEFVIDKQPTCTEAGSKSKHCTRCDEKSEVTAIPAVPHTLNHNPAAPATEDKDGNIEYWDCEDCNKFFADEDGKTEITDRASIVIPKLKADDSSALWITVIILAIIVLALGGYIAFDVLRGKKKANGETAPASEPSAAEKPEPQADERPAVEDEPAAAENKAEEPAPEQIPEPPVADEPQAVAA
ncbi:MAG: procyclic acidic repetitive family protein, partial [Clostridiales bacterium]|nr:procyclic acidic repetitive family protein [Clostridiales bacterium]